MISMASPVFWLVLSVVLYFVMNGAQIFETAVIIPRWTRSAPESFGLFHGKYGLDFKWFWIIMHSVHEIAFIIAVCLCWIYADIRYWLLFLFVFHIAIRIWTIAYFAPNIIAFQAMSNSQGIPIADIQNKVNKWRNLNYVRVLLFVAINIALVPVCMKLI